MEGEVFESTRNRDEPWAICREGDEEEGGLTRGSGLRAADD